MRPVVKSSPGYRSAVRMSAANPSAGESSLQAMAEVARSKMPPLHYGRLRWYEEVLALSTGIIGSVLTARGEMTIKKALKALFWLALGWLGTRESLREYIHSPQYTRTRLGVQYTDDGIHYIEEKGGGSTLLHCSHGFGANSLSFAALASSLKDKTDLSILAHDHPAFGLSENTAYTLDASIAQKLTAQAEDVVYLGHSMGAIAAIEAALARCAPLILIAPALSSTPRKKSRLLPIARALSPLLAWPTRLLLRRAVHTPGFWQNGLRVAWGNSPANTTAFYALPSRCRGWDTRLYQFFENRLRTDNPENDYFFIQEAAKRLPGILIIHGTKDTIVPVDNSRLLSCALPTATLIEVNGAGHNVHEQSPHKVADSIQTFLSSIGTAEDIYKKKQLSDSNGTNANSHSNDVAASQTYTWPTPEFHDQRAPVATLGKPRAAAASGHWPRTVYNKRGEPTTSIPPSSPSQ